MSAADTHAVLVRPLTTGRWEILEYAASAESAIGKAHKRRDNLSYGDLILAIDIAEISAIQERGKCLYYVSKNSAVIKAPRVAIQLSQPTWLLGWEGPEASAYKMLNACSGAERKLLVTTACAVARVALPCVPADENRRRAVIETAEAWARGEATTEQVKKISNKNYLSIDADSLNDPTAAIAALVSGYYVHDYTATPASRTARIMSGDYMDNIRQLSHIVREYIPLHIVLQLHS